MLPDNVQPGTTDPIPDGVFLVPLCTTREALTEMIYALDSAYAQTGKLIIIKDFLNALQYIENPQDAMCMASEPPIAPVVTIENDGDCQRILIDGLPATGWICPPDPEQPPVPSGGVGQLGLTIEELECFYMACFNIIPLLRFEDGRWQGKDDCCNWVDLPGQDAPAVTTSTAAQVAAGMSYQQWVDAGKPPLPTLDGTAHTDTGYTTAASLQCAKASALVNTMKQFLGEIKENLSSLVDDNLSFSDVVELIAAGFIIGNLPGAFAVASLLFGAKESAETINEQIDDNLADSEMWLDVICETTERMNNSQVIGTDDVDEVITNWQERDLSGELLKQIIYAYPVSTWQKITTSALPDTDCDCEQYLPGGYIKPIPSGSFQFVLDRLYGAFGTDGLFTEPDIADPLSAVNTIGEQGTLVAGYPQTELIANVGSQWRMGAGALLKMSEPATITQLKLNFILPSGEGAGANAVGIAALAFNSDTEEWEDMGGAADTTSPVSDELVASGSWDNVTYIAIGLAFTMADSGAQKQARAVSIRLQGQYGIETFADLELGEIYNP